jgi:hypothetical protein
MIKGVTVFVKCRDLLGDQSQRIGIAIKAINESLHVYICDRKQLNEYGVVAQ